MVRRPLWIVLVPVFFCGCSTVPQTNRAVAARAPSALVYSVPETRQEVAAKDGAPPVSLPGAISSEVQPKPTSAVVVHLESFRTKPHAEAAANTLDRRYDISGGPISVRMVNLPGKGRWYRVVMGGFSAKQEALEFCKAVRREKKDCNVLKE